MKLLMLIICLFCTTAFAVDGNFNGDCLVDFRDFAILANNWQSETPDPNTDLDLSGVVDFNDLAIFVSHWLEQEPPTEPPQKATNPTPADSSNDVGMNQILIWSTPACWVDNWDVWFGEPNNLTKVLSDTTNLTYTPSLQYNTQYQWRVDTKNSQGTTTGDLWTFTTADQNAPVASNISESAYTYIVRPITLIATDDGFPNPPSRLKYVITALPDDANAYLQDPISGGQSRITSSNLPYKLSSWGNTIWLATSTVGITHFHFKAFDGEFYSDEKQVDVNTVANPKDCISFDGSGYVTVPDNSNLDLVTRRGVGLFIQTRISFLKLLSKYTSGTAGYEFYLIGGMPTVKLYDSAGLTATVSTGHRVDDGTWHSIGFCYDANATLGVAYIQMHDGDEADCANGSYNPSVYTEWVEVPYRDYTNAESLIIGSGYKWNIDNVRTYLFTSYTNDLYNYVGYAADTRTASGTSSSWGGIYFTPSASVRFHCNYDGVNNNATQIYDDKAGHLIGTFNSSSHVRYYPFFWHWYDSAAMQHVGGGQ